MLKDYFLWWSKQMRQWLPARLVDADAATNALVILTGPNNTLTAILRRRGRNQTLGDFAADATGTRALREALPNGLRPPAILLRLPADMLLEREVVLPLVADQEAERILGFEMDRFTPFSNSDVFWTAAAGQRDRERAKLHVRLSMVIKSAVQPILSVLSQADLVATGIEIPRADAAICQIGLQRPDRPVLRFGRSAVAAAAFGCAVLALATFILPFALQSIEQTQIEGQIEAMRPRVGEAEALQARVSQASAGVDVFTAEQARIGDVLTILADITEKLPDDTFLTDLSLRQGKLLINGQSAAAVRLIAALSGDKGIRNPEFVAPVNRVDGGRIDVFAIRAEVAN